jgi:hypothetical protein
VFVELNKKSLVVQSNKLIEARYRLSVEEQKMGFEAQWNGKPG